MSPSWRVESIVGEPKQLDPMLRTRRGSPRAGSRCGRLSAVRLGGRGWDLELFRCDVQVGALDTELVVVPTFAVYAVATAKEDNFVDEAIASAKHLGSIGRRKRQAIAGGSSAKRLRDLGVSSADGRSSPGREDRPQVALGGAVIVEAEDVDVEAVHHMGRFDSEVVNFGHDWNLESLSLDAPRRFGGAKSKEELLIGGIHFDLDQLGQCFGEVGRVVRRGRRRSWILKAVGIVFRNCWILSTLPLRMRSPKSYFDSANVSVVAC